MVVNDGLRRTLRGILRSAKVVVSKEQQVRRVRWSVLNDGRGDVEERLGNSPCQLTVI